MNTFRNKFCSDTIKFALMKLMLYLAFASTLLLIHSCSDPEPEPPTPHELFVSMSEEDSLKLVDEVLDSMEVELYGIFTYQDTFENNDIYCGFRPVLRILANREGQIMIGSELNDSIHSAVVKYYWTNMGLNTEEIKIVATAPDHPGYNFPFYSSISEEEVKWQIDEAINAAKEIESTLGATPEIIDFKWSQVHEWEKKLKAIKTLNSETLREPSLQASIHISYQSKDPRNKIVREVLLGYLTLRSHLCKKHFQEPYLELFHRHNLTRSKSDQEKMEAIQLMMPIVVIDKPYCKEIDACHHAIPEYVEPEIPPMVE